jgi:hypothetical protein
MDKPDSYGGNCGRFPFASNRELERDEYVGAVRWNKLDHTSTEHADKYRWRD